MHLLKKRSSHASTNAHSAPPPGLQKRGEGRARVILDWTLQRHNITENSKRKRLQTFSVKRSTGRFSSGSVLTDNCVFLSSGIGRACVFWSGPGFDQSCVWTSKSFSAFAYDQDHIGVIPYINDGLFVLLWIEYPCLLPKTVNA